MVILWQQGSDGGEKGPQTWKLNLHRNQFSIFRVLTDNKLCFRKRRSDNLANQKYPELQAALLNFPLRDVLR